MKLPHELAQKQPPIIKNVIIYEFMSKTIKNLNQLTFLPNSHSLKASSRTFCMVLIFITRENFLFKIKAVKIANVGISN